MSDQPKQEQETKSAVINLDPQGRVQIVTTGPLTEQVLAHLSAMLREWQAAGQTFTLVTTSGVTSSEKKKG